MKTLFSLDAKREIKMIYMHDKVWWEDHLEKYCALNPDENVNPRQVLRLFGTNWAGLGGHPNPALSMATKVVAFWESHPSVEELLCKK